MSQFFYPIGNPPNNLGPTDLNSQFGVYYYNNTSITANNTPTQYVLKDNGSTFDTVTLINYSTSSLDIAASYNTNTDPRLAYLFGADIYIQFGTNGTTLYKFNSNTGALISSISTAGFMRASNSYAAGGGYVYGGSDGGGPISRVDLLGNLSQIYTGGEWNTGLAVDTVNNKLYATFINAGSNSVFEINLTGSLPTAVKTQKALLPGSYCLSMTFGFGGYLYCAIRYTNDIYKLSADKSTATLFAKNTTGKTGDAWNMVYANNIIYLICESNVLLQVFPNGTMAILDAGLSQTYKLMSLTYEPSTQRLIAVNSNANGTTVKLNTLPVNSVSFVNKIVGDLNIGVNNLALYQGTNTNPITDTTTITLNVTCFKEGTKILCLVGDYEEYVLIENITNETYVKTHLNGYKKIYSIGKAQIHEDTSKERHKDRLYKLPREKYPELFEDLYITGSHSILVNDLTEHQIKQMNKIYVTENKYRLPAYIDDKTEILQNEGTNTIYHFALEHDDCYMNFGVYANGLLVETASQRFMKEFSGLNIIQ